jgi:hypothetical protein
MYSLSTRGARLRQTRTAAQELHPSPRIHLETTMPHLRPAEGGKTTLLPPTPLAHVASTSRTPRTAPPTRATARKLLEP